MVDVNKSATHQTTNAQADMYLRSWLMIRVGFLKEEQL